MTAAPDAVPEPRWRRTVRDGAPMAWSLALALLMLGPALGSGFVLTYDMVWVPDLAVRGDVWGLGSALPRAVPSDAVVAVVDEVLPGALLQKLVLVASLAGGGLGAARLAPAGSLPGALTAISVYQWTPFVAERLFFGSWPVLAGYAVLPWLVVLGRQWRTSGHCPWQLFLLVPLGSLAAGPGIASAVVLMAATAGRRRVVLGGLALLVAANAPWLVAGVLHAGDATSAAVGAQVFALHGHGALPPPLEALVLGGSWNSQVVLPSRGGLFAWVGLSLLLLAGAAGARGWWRSLGGRDALALVVPWVVGLALALITWASPGGMEWWVSHVPGGGVLRDGARSLAMCAPLLASLAGFVAGAVTARVAEVAARGGLTVAFVLVPVMVMPDAVWGLAGRLDAVDYPGSYPAVRDAVAGGGEGGDAVVVPLTSYRAPVWNERRPVADPMSRWLTVDVVASDELVVSDTTVPGEDPRVRAAAAALSRSTASGRAEALAAMGIGYVVVERDAPGDTPDVEGEVILDDDVVTVVALRGVNRGETSPPSGWYPAIALAWTAFLGSILISLAAAARSLGGTLRRARRRHAPGSGPPAG